MVFHFNVSGSPFIMTRTTTDLAGKGCLGLKLYRDICEIAAWCNHFETRNMLCVDVVLFQLNCFMCACVEWLWRFRQMYMGRLGLQ